MGPTLNTSKLVSYITPLDKSIENRDVERDTPPPPQPASVASFPLTPPKLSPLDLNAAASAIPAGGFRGDFEGPDPVVNHLPLETPPESPELQDDSQGDENANSREEKMVAADQSEKTEEEEKIDDRDREEEEEDVPFFVTPPMDHEYCLSPPPPAARSNAVSPSPTLVRSPAPRLSPSLLFSPPPPPPLSPVPSFDVGDLRSVTAGLRNRGLYCYMNSIIQCLANIPKMKKWFLEAALTPKAPLAMEYQKLTRQLWTSAPFVDPNPFVEALPAFDFPFTRNKQHDSSEFLVWFLNALHQDLAHKKDGDRRSVTTSLKTSQVRPR